MAQVERISVDQESFKKPKAGEIIRIDLDGKPTFAKVLIDKEGLDKLNDRLADQIQRDYGNTQFLIVGILTGGDAVMVQLREKLWERGMYRFLVGYIGSSGYNPVTHEQYSDGTRITEERLPAEAKDGIQILTVDCIYDTGSTNNISDNHLRKRYPNSQIKHLVQVVKDGNQTVDSQADYIGEEVDGRYWLFGNGPDGVGGMLRGAPFIARLIPDREVEELGLL